MQNASKDISNYEYYFFIGIGGIGMSALARYFNSRGKKVLGYDRTETELTQALKADGIEVHYEDSVVFIPKECTPENTQVVFTPAIPQEHLQYNHFINEQFSVKKRSQVLGDITKDKFTIAVAGTHGKTTTSSMIAHMLKSSGKNVTAFLGGITTNYGTNYLEGEPNPNEIVVVEADEFDRSFLHLHPDIAIVTSVEADHLDIYGDGSELIRSFKEFASQVKGSLIVHHDFEKHFDADVLYSLEEGDFYAEEAKVEQRKFVFDVHTTHGEWNSISLKQPGFHNQENALAALAVAVELNIAYEDAKQAFETYEGVKRRFDWIVNEPEMVYVDDYAHHPTEIKQFIRSMKALIPDKKLVVVFQPHLYSRTRDFADGFSKSLSLADEVVLLDIYPARELPIEGVDSKMLSANITVPCRLLGKEEVVHWIKEEQPQCLATLGAGDIDRLVFPIKEMLLEKMN